MKIIVETIVKPTEDLEKVKKAVLNIFDGEISIIEEKDNYRIIRGESSSRNSLEKLQNLIRMNQIIPASRTYMLKNIYGNTLTILLHKQAAYMNKLSFIDSDKESPLGAIKIIIETDDPMSMVDWLAPAFNKRASRDK